MAERLETFKTEFPDAWSAYAQLRDACDQSGPLNRKTIELMKVAVSTVLEHEGGVVAHISRAKKAGASDNEIYHAILATTGLAGFPATLAAMGTATDYLQS